MELLAIIITLIYGAIAGWLLDSFKNNNFGLTGSVMVGIIGGFIGYCLLFKTGINAGGGWLGYILGAGFGALILVSLLNMFIPRRV
jgi:uncharacterized membrane protein YeaQ/YmgE (transglycosylase-associated protein family)